MLNCSDQRGGNRTYRELTIEHYFELAGASSWTLRTRRVDARSRVTTAYMSSNFAFGALGSAAASVAWSAGGWGAVSAVGLGLAVLGVLGWAADHATADRRQPSETIA
jgi:hypothetical protein